MIAARTTGLARDNASGKLRMAVPKGALFAECLAALAAAGVDVAGLADPGRHLLISAPEFEFLVGKPSDIPIYVAS
ncbi:MAG: hypothetical protein KJ747_09045, partial [Actinobacteria bacterium]|nr:hypothetical protein [Actinomycetota bacterium]